jgi:hypothetical protein
MSDDEEREQKHTREKQKELQYRNKGDRDQCDACRGADREGRRGEDRTGHERGRGELQVDRCIARGGERRRVFSGRSGSHRTGRERWHRCRGRSRCA